MLAELLELAPFGSVLFSSDAYGLPSSSPSAPALFRARWSDSLDGGSRRRAWSGGDAERIARMVTSGNARRAYGLADPAE